MENDINQMFGLFNNLAKDILGTTINPNIFEESSKCFTNMASNIGNTMTKILSLSQLESELHKLSYDYGKFQDETLIEKFKELSKKYYDLKVNSNIDVSSKIDD